MEAAAQVIVAVVANWISVVPHEHDLSAYKTNGAVQEAHVVAVKPVHVLQVMWHF